ncbi:MAG: phage holin family protein [Dehalococcoidia bacterium]
MVLGFLLRLVINAAALGVATWLSPGITADNLTALLFAALIFGIVNAIVKPILAFVTCPLIVLTLGLFLLVLNAAMMGLTAWIAGQFDIGFHIESFGDALLGAIIVAIVSWALTQLTD